MRLFRARPRPTKYVLTSSTGRKPRPWCEFLEDRTLLSGLGFVQPHYVLKGPSGPVTPSSTSAPTGYTPSQILHGYGFDQISFGGGVAADGTGSTIAIVDAFDDPTIGPDLHQFDLQFHLPDPPMTVVNQTGGSVLPVANPGWASEIALDVQWSHAIAPKARILLVEANDNYFTDMLIAVNYAARQPGVVAVSMSWGGTEDSSETLLDGTFVTPPSHSGVTFIASSGDRGAPPEYPSSSPNVVAVGGTHLTLDTQGNRLGESAWSGSGGGISSIEAQPAYQHGVVTQSSSFRTDPDVAYDADPYSGFPVYDSFNNGSTTPWSQFGGTSAGAPQWAALIAIADQGRALAGKSALDGRNQTLPMLYQLASTDFNDITTGSSLGFPPYSAGPGYDLVTGWGTPIANRLVADLNSNPVQTGPHFGISAPASSTAGATFLVTVTALDQSNNTLTGYTGTVHFTSSDSAAFLPLNYTFGATDNGVHTFTHVILGKAGSDTLTATDISASSMTGSATVSVTATSPNHFGFGQQPANSVAGSSITPAVTMQVLDPYNNLVSADNGRSVSVALGTNAGNGTLSGTLTATVSNGIATFSNLSINKTGTGYTLNASSSSLSSATSAAFNITPGTASQLAFGQKPTNTPIGARITPPVTVQVLDAQGNVVTGDSGDAVTMAVGANPSNGILSGTLTVTALSGVATFSNLAISKTGTGYTLIASGPGLTSVTSAAFNITSTSTTTAVASSANPGTWKQSLTFTATVSGSGAPTGTVTFSDGPTSLGQGTLNTSGGTTTASFTTSSLAVGNHTITASYGGDSNFQASTATLTQTVNKASTTTAVVSSANPSSSGQSATFTTTISSPGSPTGVVTFSDGGTSIGQGTLSTSAGTTTASFTTSLLTVGNHTITASYGGDANFATSVSPAITQTIAKATTATSVVSSAASSVWGQSVTFTATVTGSGSPTGVVTFSDGPTSIGQGALSTTAGKTTASFTTSSLAVASHVIIAFYTGDGNFQASAASLGQTVAKAGSTTAVTSSLNPSAWGKSVTLTAIVAAAGPGAGTPTGTIQFLVDGSNAGSPVNVSTIGGVTSASFSSATLLAVGSHTVTARYNGDTNFTASSSTALTQTVNKASSTTAVVSGTNPAVWGQSVAFTATVTVSGPTNPTGVVVFSDGGASIGQGTLSSNGAGTATASFSTSTLSVASHPITASYGGDGNFSASTGAAVTQTVTRASSATAAVSSANPSVFGQSVTFTATATGGPSSPTGVVIFSDGGTNIGQGTLSNSGGATTASFSTSSLAVGNHTITVSYGGDSNYLPSTVTLIQTVSQAASTTGLISSANPATAAQPVIFTATVTANAPGAGTPTGAVQFQIDGSNFGSPVSLSGTQATSMAVNSLSVGRHTISAIYSGDTSFTTSNGTLMQGINPGPASIFSVSGFPSVSAAGARGNFTVTVLDAYGNAATDYRGTVHFTSSDNLASLPADYPFSATDNGVHIFSAVFLTAGTQSLTAADALNGSITGTQSGMGITAAPPDHFRVVPAVTATVAGTPFDITVTVQDPYNNTVTGYSGSISFSSADPHGATLPAGYTFLPADNGSHTFPATATLYKVGTWDVTVTDAGNGISGTANVTVTPAPAVRFQIVAPGSTAANTPFDVTVTAVDPYLNIDTNYQGMIAFSATDSDPGVTLPASYAFMPNDAGVHTFTAGVILMTPGDQTLNVTDSNGLTGSAVITVVPQAPPGPAGGGKGAGGGLPIEDWRLQNETLQNERPVNLQSAICNPQWVAPWSERPSARRLALPGIEEAVDLLFAGGYERPAEMIGDGLVPKH